MRSPKWKIFNRPMTRAEKRRNLWREIQLRQERVWARVIRRGPDECWGWDGALHSTGYALTAFAPGKVSGKWVHHPELVHRVVWALENGRMPKQKAQICHTCDNRACVNPAHLYEGDAFSNLSDAIARDRFKDPRKLKFSDAEEMRRRYKPYCRENGVRALGREFGIAFQTVSEIIQGKHYPRPWSAYTEGG